MLPHLYYNCSTSSWGCLKYVVDKSVGKILILLGTVVIAGYLNTVAGVPTMCCCSFFTCKLQRAPAFLRKSLAEKGLLESTVGDLGVGLSGYVT